MICGAHFLKAERRGKNILIHLSNDHTILIHMKMTGHLLYGQYDFDPKTNTWRADEDGPLQDPFNQHIRLVFSVANATSNIKSENENTNREKNKSRQSETCQLAFSDLRKFAKVFVFPTKELATLPDLVHIGPEPLEKNFTYDEFKTRLQRWPNRPIKQILMDQTAVAGIGNIYSDEMLWAAGIHPLSHIPAIPEKLLQLLFKEMKLVLDRGIYFGGDSESDYRNIDGVPGEFQNKHHVYRHTGETCERRGCNGTIARLKVGGRSAHFCPKHQTLFAKTRPKSKLTS
jgi:formamidopyrimidine-DNA glycosylase